jgi:Anti-sigma-K factor rskA
LSPLYGDGGCARAADAAPYVMGALDDWKAYAGHLAECPTCRDEVAALQPVVDALPASVEPLEAPEQMQRRILSAVRAEAGVLAAAWQAAEPPARRRRFSLPRRWPALSAGLAAAAVATIVLLALSGGSSERNLTFTGQLAAGTPNARATLHQFSRSAELVVSGMPPPQAGRIYEVWLASGREPTATNALFGVTGSGSGSVAVPGDLHGVHEVLVTSEPIGGSLHPTRTPLIRVVLRA